MGDPLKKVQPGQRLRIPAQTFNTFIDAARDYLERRQGGGGGPLAERPPQGVVRVKNSSGAARARFEILGIDAPLFGPADNEEEFKNAVALRGVTPAADHVGRFVILLEPLKDGCIGRGLVQGLTSVHVRVDEGSEDLEFADVCTDEGEECPYLVLAGQGAAQILYLAPAEDPPADPDVRWALVRLSNPPPADSAAVTHTLKVTGVWASYGVPFNPNTHRFITFITGYFAFSDKSWVDESTEFYIKATNLPESARVGFKDIQVDDFVGYVMLDGFEPVLGGAEGLTYDGQVIAFPGPEGALLSTSQKITGGPGIKVDEDPDPTKDEPKVSVDLAGTSPGLEFTDGTDDGQLRVKANGAKGVTVTAAGVEVKPNTDRGIVVTATGVEVKPNTAAGIDVDTQGVKVVPDTTHGLQVAAAGVQAKLAAAGGLQFDGAGDMAVKPKPDSGITVDAQGVAVKANTTKGVGVDADGVRVNTADADGLAFDGTTGDLKVKPSATKPSVELLADGVAVKINETDGGLEHNEAGLQVKIKADKHIDVGGDGLFHTEAETPVTQIECGMVDGVFGASINGGTWVPGHLFLFFDNAQHLSGATVD